LESEELIARVQAMYDAAHRRAEEADQLREMEARRREEAEQEVARLLAELERLKR
jgi:nitrate/TMAO reductase-like tetraheme cytochrome c subunit